MTIFYNRNILRKALKTPVFAVRLRFDRLTF
jgi:hypothetical protein